MRLIETTLRSNASLESYPIPVKHILENFKKTNQNKKTTGHQDALLNCNLTSSTFIMDSGLNQGLNPE